MISVEGNLRFKVLEIVLPRVTYAIMANKIV